MKYCINYYTGASSFMMERVEEVKIKVESHHTDADLLTYLESVPAQQRLIINISKIDAEQFSTFVHVLNATNHKNFTLLIDTAQINNILEIIKTNNFNFYLTLPINNWEKLSAAVTLGVSDVLITDEFGFELKDISKYAHDKGIRVRVIPNLAQTSSPLPVSSIKTFFIRPEDTFLYDDYVDVFEFFGPLDKQGVLWRIYRDNRWMDKLQYVIYNSNLELISDRILPYFGATRLNCKKRCNSRHCDVCPSIEQFGYAVEENMNERFVIEGPKKQYTKEEIESLKAELTTINKTYSTDFSIDF